MERTAEGKIDEASQQARTSRREKGERDPNSEEKGQTRDPKDRRDQLHCEDDNEQHEAGS